MLHGKNQQILQVKSHQAEKTTEDTEKHRGRARAAPLCNSVLSVVKMGTLRPRTLALMGLANERAVFPGYGTAARLLG